MTCDKCGYCTKGPVLYACGLTGCEFRTPAYSCELVNKDGTVNHEHPFFREVEGK